MHDLDWACGTVPTPHGPIHSAWTRTPDRLRVWIDAPNGTVGRLRHAVPDGAGLWLDGQPMASDAITPGRHLLEVVFQPEAADQ
jgi:Bacterial alpha-L-rhamnosidase C-terminal domain